MDRCEACRFDYYGLPRAEVPDRLRASGADHVERLTETPAAFLRQHPPPGWSALEYGCHVRDVLLTSADASTWPSRRTRPSSYPMGRDELAVNERYNEQDPSVVAAELAAAAEALAAQLDASTRPAGPAPASTTTPSPRSGTSTGSPATPSTSSTTTWPTSTAS